MGPGIGVWEGWRMVDIFWYSLAEPKRRIRGVGVSWVNWEIRAVKRSGSHCLAVP